MSSTKIQVRGQLLPRIPARNHRMIYSVVCGVSTKRHHRESSLLSRETCPSSDSVPTKTDKSQFLCGDVDGKFGRFGGKFVPETLISSLKDLEDEFNCLLSDQEFQEELTTALRDYVGRETPLYFAGRLTEHYKNIGRTIGVGPEIYLKREDLSHCGSHKINNALAQAMIARRLGCSHVVAATGAGQHGVATAAACAKLSLECTVYMGATDMEKQFFNVLSMKQLGAQVKSVKGTFKDASSEAIRHWVENLDSTYFLLGTVVGPHPCPIMVREFQSVIGKETRRQAHQLWGGKPDVLVACVGSGANALGLFHEFVGDEDVRLVGVEAAGLGLDSGKHSATLAVGHVGVYHGSMSYLLQDDQGQILKPHSVGVGLEYPGVGPEISFLKQTGRAEFYTATDQEAIQACMRLSRLEGIIPALETSHALAFLDKLIPTLRDGAKVIVNCSGRGDKDLDTLIQRGISFPNC
ncbi:PREDICTED: tryptophan synthase beta chain 1-like [Camelina sativa]|uniref:Tryptophan synthase n=1 Tax=Camelina sativa TaxID=90675 RepID=A0ABM0WTV4_CAMSA|nr:PREDICTED: tryptophan synthase beta chain 1-like [Camelina sativa]